MNDVYNVALDENLDETELGQLHALHIHENALAQIRANFKHGFGLSHCEDCGEEIPIARRTAVPGVTRCIECQVDSERC